MRLLLVIYGLLPYFLSLASATALTYKLAPNEKACFFANVEQKGAKIAFYFAVSFQLLYSYARIAACCNPVLICIGISQVQSGGSFDVDYTVTGPGGRIIMEDTKERQLDSVFTAKEEGEHRFCFNNEMSTFAEKMVDFEIAVRSAPLFLLLQPSPPRPVLLCNPINRQTKLTKTPSGRE